MCATPRRCFKRRYGLRSGESAVKNRYPIITLGSANISTHGPTQMSTDAFFKRDRTSADLAERGMTRTLRQTSAPIPIGIKRDAAIANQTSTTWLKTNTTQRAIARLNVANRNIVEKPAAEKLTMFLIVVLGRSCQKNDSKKRLILYC